MRRMFFGVVLGSVTTAVVLMVGTAFAGTGVGAVFNLGRTNKVNATSTLTGSVSGRTLQVTNTSTGAGATGIDVKVSSGKPPFATNSTTKVANLNADLLDGKDSTSFLPASTVRRLPTVTLGPCDCTGATALITIGQLTFSGACVKSSMQVLHLEITSSVDHSAYADLTQAGAGGTFGNGNMAAGQRNLLANVSTQNVPSAIFTPVTGEALSADGHQVFYDLYMGQNVGSVNDGTCVFGGSFAVN